MFIMLCITKYHARGESILNIQKYLAFVKAVEYGSFTRAADALNYTQSGISRMINDLESEWGISLFERGRAGISLTSDYPGIDFELLLGDYMEIESWIIEGRVDFGFLRLPTKAEMETIFVEQDRLLVVIPQDHPLADCDQFPINELLNSPFMLLEKGAKAEISEIFEKHQISPQISFTTWDDYAIMSMVENGLGISILPELILQRIPYQVIAKELDVPAFRNVGIAMRDQKSLSLAAQRFLEYLSYRKRK